MPLDLLDAIPVLPYVDIHAAHDFLVNVIGFDSAGLVEHEGHVVHGEVRAGDRRFWLHESAGALTTPAQAGVRTGGIVLHVADVDAHYERVRARARRSSDRPRTRTTANVSTASEIPKVTIGTSQLRSSRPRSSAEVPIPDRKMCLRCCYAESRLRVRRCEARDETDLRRNPDDPALRWVAMFGGG